MYMIDIPSPFATAEQWREFLAEMRTLPQDDPNVREAVAAAEQALRELRGAAIGDKG